MIIRYILAVILLAIFATGLFEFLMWLYTGKISEWAVKLFRVKNNKDYSSTKRINKELKKFK